MTMEHLKERLLQGKTDLLTFLRWVVFSLIIGVVVGGVGILFHYSIEIAGTWRMGHPWLLYLLPVSYTHLASTDETRTSPDTRPR